MGLIVERETGIETVGQLIEALRRYPADMPVESGCERVLHTYRVQPQKGECVDDKRGIVTIEGDDGSLD